MSETRATSKLPPTLMERAPRPELGCDPIPKERYTSGDFMHREWERMLTHTWLLAAFESDYSCPTSCSGSR